MIKTNPVDIYKEFTEGESYNSQINLYENIETNNKFYNGNQWEGLGSELSTPVFNIFKKLINLNSQVVYTDEIGFDIDTYSAIVKSDEYKELFKATKQEIDSFMENEKFKVKLQDGLVSAQIEGDMFMYFYFYPNFKINETTYGVIRCELINPENVIFSNKSCSEVSKQDFIIIRKLYTVEAARKYLKECKKIKGNSADLSDSIIESLKGDSRSSINVDDASLYADDKVAIYVKLWIENGNVTAVESTKDILVRSSWNTGMSLLPVALFNWEKVRNCYHGNALMTELIDNQIFINKMYSMEMLDRILNGFPKVLHDKERIPLWDNRVGGSIPVDMTAGGRMEDVAMYMLPGEMSNQNSAILQDIISQTLNLAGANEALRGEINADNTSAIIALQKSSSIPLELQKRSFKQFVEDCIRILIDMMGTYYGERESYYIEDNDPNVSPQNFKKLKDIALKLSVNVGPAAYWAETDQISSMDNLYLNKIINAYEYVKRLPENRIPDKQEIIDRMEQEQQMQQSNPQNPQNPLVDESALGMGV